MVRCSPRTSGPMPTVAQLPGNVRIEQRYREHNPPHFHAICGDDEASFSIALPIKSIKGKLKLGAEQDIVTWAEEKRPYIALNWIDAMANAKIQRIP